MSDKITVADIARCPTSVKAYLMSEPDLRARIAELEAEVERLQAEPAQEGPPKCGGCGGSGRVMRTIWEPKPDGKLTKPCPCTEGAASG